MRALTTSRTLPASGLALLAVVVASGCAPSRPAAELGSPVDQPRLSRVRAPDGVELAVEEVGPADAQAIVFIHGLGFSREVWHRQLEGTLGRRFHLIAYDTRGHGQSSRPTDEASYADATRLGADLDAVLTATHAQRPVLVAWSIGGVTVGEYLRSHGDAALGGLVLIDAVTSDADPAYFGPGSPRNFAAMTAADEAIRRRGTEAFVRSCFREPLPPGELSVLLNAVGVLPASEYKAILSEKLDGLEAAYRAVKVPTWVIQGRADDIVTAKMSEHTAALVPGARLVTYADSGHAPFMDETWRFDTELSSFVDGK